MHEDCWDFHRLQFHSRRPGQPQEPLDDALQPVQLTVDDLEAGGQLIAHLGGQHGQVFFEQLDVDVERTEGVTDLVRQPPQEPRQQVAFLRGSQLCRILAQRLC